MIDVYGIGVTLKLNDLVGPHLLRMAEQFEKIELSALQLNRTLKDISVEAAGMKGLSNAAGSLDKNLTKANEQTLLLERNLKAVRALGSVPGGVINSGHGGSSPLIIPARSGGGGRGGHGGMHGGNVHAGSGGIGIGAVGMGLPSGALLPLAAAGVGVYATHALYESAKDYEMAFTRFKSLNLGKAVNDDADKFVKETKTFGVSMTERMTMLRDLHEIMGSYEEAKSLTPLFSEMLASNLGVFGEAGNKFDTKSFQALGKVIELRGGTSSEAEARKQANLAQKVITGSAGLVKPEDMLAFMKTGGVATRLLSNRAFYAESAPMIQEMGGNRFGTALMSAHQNLAMGRGSLQAMKEASRLGLIDPKMIEYSSIGTIKRVLPGALANADLYNTSKLQWLEQTLIPAIRKKGVIGAGHKLITGDAISDDQIVNEMNLLFSQRTASNAFSQMFLQRHKIHKNIGVTEEAMGIDQLSELNKKSPAGAEHEFMAAWTDFKTEFGKGALPIITSMLNSGAELLRTVNAFMGANRELITDLSKIEVPHSVFGLAKMGYEVARTIGKNGVHTAKSINPVVDKADGGMVNVATQVHMDGFRVGNIVSKHQARQATNGFGTGMFDNGLSMGTPGIN